MKTREEIVAELDADIPRNVIEQREGGGSKKLSYLAGWFVIDRMNKIFGPDGWSYDVTELRCVHSGEMAGKYGAIQSASYVATVALFVQFPGAEQAKRLTDVGFGNGTDKVDPGKPHELATKEAVTDAIKRCAKSLGMSLGLALYTKNDEYIEDAPKAAAQAPKPAPTQTVSIPKGMTDKEYVEKVADALNVKPPSDREALNKRITAMSNVILAKVGRTADKGGTPEEVAARKAKLDELKANIKHEWGADSVADLDDKQAKQLLAALEAKANG